MSSVQSNMKRVNLTFLAFSSDNILAQVLKKPPYNNIQYAAAFDKHFHLNLPSSQMAQGDQPEKTNRKDITIYLTKPHQYFFVVKGHIGQRSVAKMWLATTIARNKNKFVTVFTSLNKFDIRNTSGVFVTEWIGYNDSVRKYNNQTSFNQHTL